MGETAAFACAVEGAGAADLAYQWQYTTDGETWRNLGISGWPTSRSAMLEAQAISARVGKQTYRCVVTASDGRTATTDAVTYAIALQEEFIQLSVFTDPVALGETAYFSCAVDGANDASLSYRWQYSADGGESWVNLGWASAKTDILEAQATTNRVGKQSYRCVVTASDGRQATSDAVTFDIA